MRNEWFSLLISTNDDWTGLVLRAALGLVLFPHTVQKLFGWFDGPGIPGEINLMTSKIGLPLALAYLAITVECGGTLLLLLGCFTRLAAFALFVQFVVIIRLVHYRNGFFMNWFAKMERGKEGFEYHLLVLGLCTAIILEGGGKFSVDLLLSRMPDH